MRDIYHHHRFAVLFVVFLVTLLVGPWVDTQWPNADAGEILVTITLFVAVFSQRLGRAGLAWFLGLAVAGILMRWLPIQLEWFVPVSRLLMVSLLLALSVRILRVVLRSGPVDSERIFAALSLYMLFGMAFGILFGGIEAIHPGSLRGIQSVDQGTGDVLNQSIYFSFVTLATLGYGDITPASALTRGLVNIESIVGQLYLAVLIARLVSLHGRAHENHSSPK